MSDNVYVFEQALCSGDETGAINAVCGLPPEGANSYLNLALLKGMKSLAIFIMDNFRVGLPPTALHSSVVGGKLECVRFVISQMKHTMSDQEFQCFIDRRDNDNYTAIRIAINNGKPDIVAFLCENGAPLTQYDTTALTRKIEAYPDNQDYPRIANILCTFGWM
jgi:hypothetical protein